MAEEEDRRAKEAQRLLIASKGGPEHGELVNQKLYTREPTGLIS
jgi:hypothetical protein